MQDYSDRRLSQKYLGVVDRDFYEWETHIFFDDAFELGDNDEEQQVSISPTFYAQILKA
jgi:chitin synthase